MKFLTILLFGLFANTTTSWTTDFAKAKSDASATNKYILVNFSGSDWCTPCIRMHKTIFENAAFDSFATKELVLVNADFPRLKKHQLSKEQQQKNDALAEELNPSGKFPYTLVIDAKGKVVKTWDGCPKETALEFVSEINNVIHAGK